MQPDAGLDEHGFFAVDASSGKFVFRAQRVSAGRYQGPVEWTDMDTGVRYVNCLVVSQEGVGPVGAFHVENRPVSPAFYSKIVDALVAMCRAAIETGNPIVWC